MKLGVPNILIKGGHFKSKVHDIFAKKMKSKYFQVRINTKYSWNRSKLSTVTHFLFMWKTLKKSCELGINIKIPHY